MLLEKAELSGLITGVRSRTAKHSGSHSSPMRPMIFAVCVFVIFQTSYLNTRTMHLAGLEMAPALNVVTCYNITMKVF
jgi:hypothetical protein